MDASLVRKYFFSALLVVAVIFGIFLFWPFLKVIILAIVFAVLLHPLYRWIQRRVKFPALASFLTLLCFILIICVPLYFVSTIILQQFQSMYQWLIGHGSLDTATHHITIWLHHLFPSVSFNLQDRMNTIVTQLPSTAGVILATTFSTIVSSVFMLIALFYFLKDGPKWKEALIDLVPLSNNSNRQIAAALKRTINGMFKGYIVVGLAQGIVTTIGLYLFHVPHAALWGMLAIFASIIPPLGVGAISISVVTYLFLVSRTGAAVGYAIWAICFSMTIDNILNPYIVGRQIAIHPLLVLFSVLGGLALMGPVGILIGPLVISFIYALLSVYSTEMKEDSS